MLLSSTFRHHEPPSQDLITAGPPPYGPDVIKWIPLLAWANELDPAPPRSMPSPGTLWLMAQSLFAPRGFPADAQFSQTALWPEISAVDLTSLGPRFEVPVVLVQGSEDIVTLTALAKDYFDRMEAPSKEFVLLPGIGHLAIFRAQDSFLEALLDHVRPLAVPAQAKD